MKVNLMVIKEDLQFRVPVQLRPVRLIKKELKLSFKIENLTCYVLFQIEKFTNATKRRYKILITNNSQTHEHIQRNQKMNNHCSFQSIRLIEYSLGELFNIRRVTKSFFTMI
jgi:hypothetical protein